VALPSWATMAGPWQMPPTVTRDGTSKLKRMRERGSSRRSSPSRLRKIGWTQEALIFTVPVQAVQPVQPKIKTGRKEAPLPLRAKDSRRPYARYKICQKGRTGGPRWTEPITVGISHVQRRTRDWTGYATIGPCASAALSAKGT